MNKWWVHKYEVRQEYGGAEEGGWWYDSGDPVEGWEVKGYSVEEEAFAKARELNDQEHDRQKREEDYEYTSVLSYKSRHFSYQVEETSIPKAYPEVRPHYE